MYIYTEPFGHHIYGKTLGEVWLDLVSAVMRNGEESLDEGRERLALQSVRIKSETQEIPDELISKYANSKFVKDIVNLTFNKDKMFDFDVKPSFSPGAESYAARLENGGLMDFVVKRLTRFPESKKACIVFPKNEDYRAVLETPNDDYLPCIVSIQFRLLPPNYKIMNVIFYARSIDAYQKSAGNLTAIAIMAYKIADKLTASLKREIKVGSLDGVVADAHIYNETYDDAKETIRNYKKGRR